MTSNQNLSKNLRDIIESIEDIEEKLADDEHRLAELKEGAWSIAFGNIFLRIFIFFIYL